MANTYDNQRLARTLAGMKPQEPPPVTAASFSPFGFLPPYTGLRNEPAQPSLPPIPTASPQGNYGPAWNSPPMAAPPQPAAPSPIPPMGGQGFAGVEPPPGSMPAPYDANLDPRYLPEQWRGAFNNWQG